VKIARLAATMVAIAALAACRPAPAQSGSECLDDPEARIVIGDGHPIALRPGATATLHVVCTQFGFMESPVSVPVTWTFETNKGLGALDAKTGALALDASARPGTRAKVIAELKVRGTRQRLQSEVVVIDPAPQPWTGMWQESARLACDGNGKAGGPDSTPADKAPLMRELVLKEDGSFTVTWFPFERYKDYWGTYTVDRESGAVTFTVTGGNSVPPPGADLSGTLRIEPGVGLVLSDLYLGAPSGSTPPHACGHRFGG
jgi:hypothetical protein